MLPTPNQIISSVVQIEGRYSNDPNDAGGETKYGVTKAVAREEGYTGPMVGMKRTDAIAIYQSRFWTKPGFGAVYAVSPGIAAELFECGVNRGPSIPSIYLQRCLNALNRQQKDYADVFVDGRVGPKTIAALQAFLKVRGDHGESVLLKGLNCLQGADYIQLAERRQTDETFLFGWLDNRISLSL